MQLRRGTQIRIACQTSEPEWRAAVTAAVDAYADGERWVVQELVNLPRHAIDSDGDELWFVDRNPVLAERIMVGYTARASPTMVTNARRSTHTDDSPTSSRVDERADRSSWTDAKGESVVTYRASAPDS